MIVDRHKARRLDREAAAWFTRLNDERGVENEDLEAFDRWLQDRNNSAAYRRIQDLNVALQGLSHDPDIREAAREALTRPPQRRRGGTSRSTPTWRILGGVALAGAVAAALTVAVKLRPLSYETSVGQQTTARLTDGTAVRLDTNSQIKVRYGFGRRDVELVRGQALFEVAHDAARPFTVHAGPMSVRAVGTRFDVRRDDGWAFVVLTQGRVRVSNRPTDAQWVLAPGQGMTLGGPRPDAAPRAVDVPALTAWTSGEVVFEDTPLVQAVAEMNRYAARPIVLAAGVDGASKVNGIFSTKDEKAFLGAVTLAFALRAVPRQDGAMELQPSPGG